MPARRCAAWVVALAALWGCRSSQPGADPTAYSDAAGDWIATSDIPGTGDDAGVDGPATCNSLAPLGPWVTAFTGGAPLDCPQFPAGPPPDGVYNLVAMLNYQPNVPITTGRETWVISGGGTRLDAVQQTELGIDHWTEQLNTASGSFIGATICGDQGIRIEDYCFNSSILTLDSGVQIARYERQLP